MPNTNMSWARCNLTRKWLIDLYARSASSIQEERTAHYLAG